MARPLRIEYPFAVYHITSRGNARNPIFADHQDRQNFLHILGLVVKRYHWLCHAYCLMDNHYHLLIETPDANLSLGMRQLNGRYTQTYHRKHTTTGHLLPGRFKAILVEKDSYLLELCRYVVLNPVRAKMVESVEQWPWNSYRFTVGLEPVPSYLSVDWILSFFSDERPTAQKNYQAFVEEGLGRASPWENLQGQVLLGKEGFVETFKDHLVNQKEIQEIPGSQRLVGRPTLSSLFQGIKTKQQRDQNIRAASLEYGYTLKEIATHLNIHYTTVSKVISKENKK
ncbi:MAG: transposase [Candidatus Atribacteria bacterium]|nr:transposase [Candidatus Atribacteria bacterium]